MKHHFLIYNDVAKLYEANAVAARIHGTALGAAEVRLVLELTGVPEVRCGIC